MSICQCVLYGCVFINTRIRVKDDIKKIHQNVHRESWIVAFNSFFYTFYYVLIFLNKYTLFYGQKKLLSKLHLFARLC